MSRVVATCVEECFEHIDRVVLDGNSDDVACRLSHDDYFTGNRVRHFNRVSLSHLRNLVEHLKLSHHREAMLTALACGQHARLGEHSLLLLLDADLFRTQATLALPNPVRDEARIRRMLLNEDDYRDWGCLDYVKFVPSANGTDAGSTELSKMRLEFGKRFKIMKSEVDGNKETCRIKIDGKTHYFEFCNNNNGLYSRVEVSGFSEISLAHFRRTNWFTGLEAFVLFLGLLEEKLTPVDRARKSYNELTPADLLYASENERIRRMLTVNGIRSVSNCVYFELGSASRFVSEFDRLFNATRSVSDVAQNGRWVGDDDEPYRQCHDRDVTVDGKRYSLHIFFHRGRMGNEELCSVHGISEFDEGHDGLNRFKQDAFIFFIRLLASLQTDEDRDRPRCESRISAVDFYDSDGPE